MRTVDRVLALVLGLAGLALGIVVVAEVVQGLLGRPGHLLVPYEGVATWLRSRTRAELDAVATARDIPMHTLAS